MRLNQRKRTMILTALVLALTLLVGCDATEAWQNAYEEFREARSLIYVGFSSEESVTPVDYGEVEDYVSEWSSLRSDTYYSLLSVHEQRIYRLFEYALDHGHTRIFIDEGLLEQSERSLWEILQFFSLDSPFLEQNLSYRTKKASYRFTYADEVLEFTRSGKEIVVEAFSSDRLEKKKEALKAAREYVESLPSGLSEKELAMRFYDDLTARVSYELYVDRNEAHYLYDAFVTGKTQCDGFANAYSLLCQLAGVRCFEKNDVSAEGEEGHTWNTVYFDGAWYNVDCALNDAAKKQEKENGIRIHFAFSDAFSTVEATQFQEFLPPCTKNLVEISCTFSSLKDPLLAKQVKEAFSKTTERYVLICIESEENWNGWLQRVADELRSTVRTVGYIRDGKQYYYVFAENGLR